MHLLLSELQTIGDPQSLYSAGECDHNDNGNAAVHSASGNSIFSSFIASL